MLAKLPAILSVNTNGPDFAAWAVRISTGAVRSPYDRWQQVDPTPLASLASSAQAARPTSQPDRPAADGCERAREGQVDGGAGRAADREDRSRRPESRRR